VILGYISCRENGAGMKKEGKGKGRDRRKVKK